MPQTGRGDGPRAGPIAGSTIIGRKGKKEYFCGAAASFVNIVVTFPVYKAMFRQQLQGIRLKYAVKQLKSEGIRYLYRGIVPPLISRTMTVSLMFGTYSQYMDAYRNLLPSHPWLAAHSVSAMAAGCTEAIFLPFERIQVLLQHPHYHDRVQNTKHAFTMLRHYGIKEYYRGLSVVLLRNGPSNVLFLGLRGPLQNSLPHTDTPLGASVGAFVSGAGLGALLSTAFYPVNTVKNHMQAKLGGHFSGIMESFRFVYEERGRQMRKMFRGVHLNYTRAVLAWGVINVVYEFLIVRL